MKRKSLIVFVLVPACAMAGVQQPVGTTHLSVPSSAQQTPARPPSAVPQTPAPGANTDVYSQVQQQVMQANFAGTPFDSHDYIKLPPLDVLFESARNNPMTEYHRLRQTERLNEFKSVKNSWLRYLNVNTTYNYGIMAMSYGREIDNSSGMLYSYSDQAQHWWSVGAAINMPLLEIFDRGNRKRKHKALIEQSQYEAESWHEDRKLKIIEAYSNAGLYLALIRIKSEAGILSTQQYAMAQADFINGRINISELSYAKGIQNNAMTEYERTKSELYRVILLLEALSGYKIFNQ